MARRDPPQPRRRVVVAAGWRVSPSNRADLQRLSTNRPAWQDEAWQYFDAVGELRYATELIADLLSRCSLRVGWFPTPFVPELLPEEDPVLLDANDQEVGVPPEWPLPSTVVAAEDALTRVVEGMGGPTELLKPLAIHMQIPGESWICAWQDPGDPAQGVPAREVWRVVDRSLLDTTHETLRVKDGAKDQHGHTIGEDGYAVRIWRPHPRNREDATTHVRAMLEDLEQLLLLRRQGRQSHRTMLTNGILLVDNSVDFAAYDTDVLRETIAGSTLGLEMGQEPVELGDLILDRIRTATANEAAPETVVPIVVPVSPPQGGTLADVMHHVTFDRRVDADELAEREQLVTAIARGLPVPPEVILGLGANSNHWSSWLITEERFHTAVAPLAGLIMNALTEHVIRPLLRVAGVEESEVRKVGVWYDPTEVIQRPDPTPVVQAAHAAGVVSDQFMRQFVPGATDADRPDVIEYLTRGMREAQWTPEMVAQAFQFLNNGIALFQLTALSDPSMGSPPGGPPSPAEPPPNSPPVMPALPASSGPPPFPARHRAARR